MYDLLIVGGQVLDGSGSDAVRADVAVKDGRIIAVGDLAGKAAKQTVDAQGRTVAPGFIDTHSHDDFNLPVNPLVPGKILQGVTTQVTGNCGWSPAPLLAERRSDFVDDAAFLGAGLDYSWHTMGEFLAAMPPLAQNIAQLVGHVAVRCAAMGVEDRPPTAAELERMRHLVAESMEQGAFGFSTGLVYPPSAYADTDEIVELAKVAGSYGGGYHTHMRDEGARLFEAVREAAEIGRRANVSVQISHLKVSGKQHWGKADELLALIDSIAAEGVRIHCDQYPYPAGSSGLKSLLPLWAHDGGNEALIGRLRDTTARDQIRAEMLEGMSEMGFMKIADWKNVMIAESPKHPEFNGLDLGEIADQEGSLPVDAMLDLLLDDYAKTLAIFFIIGVEDMEKIMKHPNVSIGSDGIITARPGQVDVTKPHPRYYGTFPRVLGKYARDEAVLTLPEAVRKMTTLPADAMGMTERGRIAPGAWADLVLFDAATVLDTATYKNPQQDPVGIHAVYVNGVEVVHNGVPTGATPGQLVRPRAH